MKPYWLMIAEKYIGEKEIKGTKHNPLILKWWTMIRAPFQDDATPWCSAFVGGVLEEAGIHSTRSARARSYENWGVELKEPMLGAVAVFWRERKNGQKGHVGFLAGLDKELNPVILGGNQDDAVLLRTMPKERLLSYRWPLAVPLPDFAYAPRVAAEKTTSEA